MRVRPTAVLAQLPFACVLAAAAWIRVVAVRGYPAPHWTGDSPSYLEAALHLRPGETRPSGYPILLWLLKPFHSFTVMVSVQHAIGVLGGVLVYLLVWRAARAAWPVGPDGDAGRWAWRDFAPGLLAAPLTLPVLLDDYQIALEHMLMSDSLFTFLMLAAVTAALWRRRTTWWLGALAGMFAAFAAVTRSAGLPLVAVILVGMLLRRAGWRPLVAVVIAFVLPLGGYMYWFKQTYGQFTVSKASSIWLYGRTAAFADCNKIKPSPELRIMCPQPSNPDIAPAFAVLWTDDSPFHRIPGWITGEEANRLSSEFTKQAIEKQPGDYARVVVRDTWRSFDWHREPYPTPWTWLEYVFPEGESWDDEQALVAVKYDPSGGETKVVQPWAGRMQSYQRHMAMPGTFLGIILLGGLVGALPHLGRGGIRRRLLGPVRHWGTGALMPWGTSLALLVIPAATADFDYRYVLPAVPFACVALGLALIPAPRRVRDDPADADGPEEDDDEPVAEERLSA
ncbi:hypothetical protein [Actinomadura opuntiae]|uniref:hypothetical protein n=1 Tax=Actinomadura sp. OS1-43 TaxID=604315 RepID=UPI00255B03A2|nr:hypothetical protein [Actinomadura sp. OS1-43]MDL4814688.1 hypothetical protein [Actinomadura sp. OS1-43]